MFIIKKTSYVKLWFLYKCDLCIPNAGNHREMIRFETEKKDQYNRIHQKRVLRVPL